VRPHAFRSVVLGISGRNLRAFFTNPTLFLPGLIFPLFFFSAFAGGLSRIDQVPGFHFPSGYTAFEYVFVLFQASAFGGVFTGFSVARDYESGFARRLMLGAPNRRAIVVGYALSGLVRAMFTVTLVTAVALAAGMQVGGDGLNLLTLYVLALTVNQAAVLFGIGVALRLRTMQAGPAMQMPVFLTLFLAPVYAPLKLLAGWVHDVATVNPATRFLEAGRGLISGDPTQTLLAFGLAGGLALLLVAWALRGLRSAEQAA
jgi:ABC-2 type transport system permease protein